jgi:hypothetical protein
MASWLYNRAAPALASKHTSTRLEGTGSLSTDHQQPTGVEYLRAEVLDRFDAQHFEDWSPALLRALIAVFDLNGVTPTAQHCFRPYLVR